MSELIFLLDLLLNLNLGRFVPLTAWLWSIVVGLRVYRIVRREVLDATRSFDDEKKDNEAKNLPLT